MNKKIYIELVLYSVFLTIVVSLFSAIGVMTHASENGMILYQIMAFLLMGTVFTIYMKKSDPSLKKFGFVIKKVDYRIYLIIGVIVLVQPLILGINYSISFLTIMLLIFQMVLVGYTEETLFRAIYFDRLKTRSPMVYIIFSSIIFGILHSANAINPEATTILVVLQITNALLLGIVFSAIYYLTRNIYLLIATHALFNILASITLAGSVEANIFSVLVLSAVYTTTIIILYVQRNNLKNC
ncbi:TPA: CPBP family intramembrane metalloprotease [Bacillus pseudomycoides]|nr:CPBP family intramembrane metalloprotease [Bacillus pseudomycoides]